MMKRSIIKVMLFGKMLLVFLATFSLSSCSVNKTDNDLTKENLKGKVKTLFEQHCSFDSIENKDTGNSKITCNHKTKRIFDERGNTIERNWYYSDWHDLSGKLESKKTFIYDNKGNIIENEEWEFGRLSSKYKYKYDFNRNLIEENYYKPEGVLISKETYKYDGKRNRIEVNRYKYDGSLEWKFTYKYDNKNNKIEEKWHSDAGELYKKQTYKYDNNKNKIEEKWYKSDESLEIRLIYKYNSNGIKIEEMCFNYEGVLISTTIFNYDSKGNKIEQNIKEFYEGLESNFTITYKYDFDQQGNWIYQTIFYNGKPAYFKEREIEYFDE
jgi:hypothetical protein